MRSSDCGEEAMEGQIHLEGKFFVSVRVRPLNEKEVSRNEEVDWECITDKTVLYKNTTFGPDRSIYPSSYSYDRVFDPGCSTRQVYQEGAKAIALSVVIGINASIFAYGQTSSGKTYTMSGITEYAMTDIFDYMHKHNERDFHLKFSAMEIYNESVRDLLSLDASPLRLLDDPERGTIIDKLTEEAVRDWDHVAELLSICKAQRQIGETLLNETSSRSHQIIRLTIESYPCEGSTKDSLSALVASVNFIDLSGSERASQALSEGSRLKEGSHINRSLLALGTIIRKLSKGRNEHIPYRDSKLTRILQSSLGGNTRTAIICTMSPARNYVEQSRSTLLFATSAKQVTTSAKVNPEVSDKALVKNLQRKLARLENDLSDAGSSFGSEPISLLREKDLLIRKLERQVKELTLQRDIALSHINDSQFDVEDERLPQDPVNLPYPKLHVRRQSWVSQTSQASFGADLNSIDDSSLTFETSHDPSCRQSCSCCDESSFYSDFDEDMVQRAATHPTLFGRSYDDAPRLFIRAPLNQANESANEFGIKVRCIESTESNLSDIVLDEESGMQDNEIIGSWDHNDNSWDHNDNVDEDENLGSAPSLQPDVKNVTHGSDQDLNEEFEHDQGNLYGLGDDTDNEILSDELMSYPETFFSRETHAVNAKVSTEEVILRGDSNIADIKVVTDIQCSNEVAIYLGKNVSTKTESSMKSVKDAGFQYDLDTIKWPSDFNSLQREVLELWNDCNVSLLYRTSFFLLFEGEPEDCIYMEVERRRLSFIKEAFTWGNETVLDGQIISPSLSKKHMQQERSMLSKLLKSRISKQDREVLYVKWGVHLDTKKRSSQLAHHLWNKPDDMLHVRESAHVVSMLIKFDKSHIRKEMFGLNLMPALKGVGSHGWLHSATVRF